MNNYFRPAGDLEENKKLFLEEEIKNYLIEIVNNKFVNDNFDNLIGSGSMIISFNQLQKMVEKGNYNFIKAEYLNPEMIIVEYQEYQKDNYKTK